MARVSYVEKADVAAEALPIYKDLEERAGKVLKPIKALAHSPKLLADWWRMMMTLLTALDLDAKLRELALLRIFRLTGCDYCFAEHDRVAIEAGVTREQIDHIDDYKSHGAFDELERLVLRYAEKITTENAVDDGVFAALRERLSEREMVELTFCIGNWNGIARFIVPMGLELDSPPKG